MAYDITLPVPVVNQLDPSETDGRANGNTTEDCGESCIAAVIQYLTGVQFLPDEIKDIIWTHKGLDVTTVAPTTAEDLQWFLQSRAGISSTQHAVTSQGDAMKVIRDTVLGQSRLLIALRSFSAPHTEPFHWVVVTGCAGPDFTHTTTVRYMNPWGGVNSEQSNVDFWAWLADNVPAAGQSLLITIDADIRS